VEVSRVGGCGGRYPSLVDLCSRGKSTLRLKPGSLEGRGHQPLGQSTGAYFCFIMLISTFFDARCTHGVGSWMYAHRLVGRHLAQGYGKAGGQPR
jgi:hypothetical protein